MTTLTGFFFLVCAVVGMHRIYNFEMIFKQWRALVEKGAPWTNPITCPACNAFWIAVACTTLLYFQPIYGALFLTPFAIDPWARTALWAYHANIPLPLIQHKIAQIIPEVAKAPVSPSIISSLVGTLPTGPISTQPPVEALRMQHERYRSYEKRFVLMTTFGDWKPAYSLVSVVLDQARMLAVNDRWLVQIWVNSTCSMDGLPTNLPENIEIKKIIPPISMGNDVVDPKAREIVCSQIIPGLLILGNATVITHDLLFLASHVTFASAIHETLGKIHAFTWFHFCQVVPPTKHSNV